MKIITNPRQKIGQANPMLYGHFLEHFQRQIYGGVYDPTSRFADEDGFRTDILEAMRRIKVPIMRWPGGCFVSSYHWEKGVGKRVKVFDKSWRVEDDNSFGTDEFIAYCRKLGCEPYICTNAGTADPLAFIAAGADFTIFGGHMLARGIRYFVLVLAAGIAWPLAFPRLSKLGRK